MVELVNHAVGGHVSADPILHDVPSAMPRVLSSAFLQNTQSVGTSTLSTGANGEMLALQNMTASTLQTLRPHFSFLSHSEPGGLHGAGHGNEVDAEVLAR